MNEALYDELRALRTLAEHPGWQFLKKVVAEQREVRVAAMLQPLAKLEDALSTQYSSGEISGMTSLLGYPEYRIEQIMTTLEGIENDDRDRDTGSAAASGVEFAARAGITLSDLEFKY